MTLFDECKEALSADFHILEGQCEKEAINILYQYPFVNGNVSWLELNYIDYEDINAFIANNHNENDYVFVFVYEIGIPVFRSTLTLIAENIYDVTALSPKLFIFNDKLILQPLFPTETIRLGIRG